MSNCKYCGKESYGRPFCAECGKKYFGFNEPVSIKSASEQKKAEQTIKTKIVINNQPDYFFNDAEWEKYNLSTNNNKFFDAKYQDARIYQCKNGNKVRSKSERAISDFLTEHNIEHAYEKELPIDDLPWHNLHPDFYIPGIVTHTGRVIKNVYIEHFGGPKTNDPEDVKNYNRTTKYKLNIYKKLKITLVCTTEQDMINPNYSLKHKLLNIKENQINY